MKKILLEDGNKKKHPKIVRFVIFGLVICLIALSAEIWIVNRLSTYGDKIYQLKKAQSDLELQNQVLANSIAKASSLSGLEQKSTLLGFKTINTNQIEYIKFSDTLALR